jgi:hypothetical protein
MTFFRLFLVAVFVAISIYTLIVGLNHGWNLAPVFFGDMAQMAWPGQFNLDFMTFLLLSGLWLMWRHEFSLAGIGLGLVGVFGGMLFLSAYLLFASVRAKGNMATILLGEGRHVA